MKLPSIQQVAQESGRTFLRFPLVIISAALATVAALILIDYQGPATESILFSVLLAALLAIPILTGLSLLAEKRRLSRAQWAGIHVVGVLLLVAYGMTVPSDLTHAPVIHIIRFWILMIGAYLFAAVAPYVGTGEVNGFWHYNKTVCFRLLTSVLYSLVLYIGLAVALLALDNLFGVDIAGKRYFELLVLIGGIFNTCFFLAGVPDDLGSLETESEYPKSVRIFAQYILLPIVCLYLVILYAYIAKIAIAWNWPQGWVGRLIFGFSVTGLATILLLHPIRDRVDTGWVKTASRWFYVVLIPLIVVLFLALGRRISEYDITEGRYLGIVLAFWLAAMVSYFLLSKAKSIKAIPASLCLLSLVVCFGPWSAFSVSERSQVARLSGLLEKNAILVEGKVQKAPGTVTFDDSRQISAILGYLREVHGYERVQPWFGENLWRDSSGVRLGYKTAEDVTKMMGVEFVSQWQDTGASVFSFHVDQRQAVDISGYDHLLRDQNIAGDSVPRTFPAAGISYRVAPQLETMTVSIIEDTTTIDSLQLQLRPAIDALTEEYGNMDTDSISPDKMTVTGAGRSMRLKLCLQSIRFERRGDSVVPVSCFGGILYSIDRPEK
jgi:hypothetical protein